MCDTVWSMSAKRPPPKTATQQPKVAAVLLDEFPRTLMSTVAMNDGHARVSGFIEEVTPGVLVYKTLATHKQWTLAANFESIAGRAEPTSVLLTRSDGRPVTASHIRSLPLGDLIQACRAMVTKTASALAKMPAGSVYGLIDYMAPLNQPFTATGPHRGRSQTTEELQRVADVYRAAHQSNEPVTAAVKTAFCISASTATKRIMAARKAGLLGEIGGSQ